MRKPSTYLHFEYTLDWQSTLCQCFEATSVVPGGRTIECRRVVESIEKVTQLIGVATHMRHVQVAACGRAEGPSARPHCARPSLMGSH